MKKHPRAAIAASQRGAAAVEFALVAMILVVLLINAVQFGQVLFTWNSAAEATRRGARTAAIVAIGDNAAILAAMRLSMPALTAENVAVEYSANGTFLDACTVGTCHFVRVSITGYTYVLPFPIPVPSLALPPFATTLTAEALGNVE